MFFLHENHSVCNKSKGNFLRKGTHCNVMDKCIGDAMNLNEDDYDDEEDWPNTL